MREENLQGWISVATQEQDPSPEHCERVANLVQNVFRDGKLPTKFKRKTLVILPNGNKQYSGIDIVEFLWKTMLGLINLRIGAEVRFHNTLHGFRVG